MSVGVDNQSVELLECRNNGCGKMFNPNNNTESSCIYHPGTKDFHDGLKGWACCEKRTIVFEEVDNIPGCTRGRHDEPVEEIVKEPVKEPVKKVP